MPARLINIKYITIRAEKVASPVTALQFHRQCSAHPWHYCGVVLITHILSDHVRTCQPASLPVQCCCCWRRATSNQIPVHISHYISVPTISVLYITKLDCYTTYYLTLTLTSWLCVKLVLSSATRPPSNTGSPRMDTGCYTSTKTRPAVDQLAEDSLWSTVIRWRLSHTNSARLCRRRRSSSNWSR